MAHYAQLDDNNYVTQVIVGADETDDAPEGFDDWEEFYSDRYGVTVKRCSYNTRQGVHILDGTPFRGSYPRIGDKYYEEEDVFAPEAPYESWSLDEDGVWQPPEEMPLDGTPYVWNENKQEWESDEGVTETVELPPIE